MLIIFSRNLVVMNQFSNCKWLIYTVGSSLWCPKGILRECWYESLIGIVFGSGVSAGFCFPILGQISGREKNPFPPTNPEVSLYSSTFSLQMRPSVHWHTLPGYLHPWECSAPAQGSIKTEYNSHPHLHHDGWFWEKEQLCPSERLGKGVAAVSG